MERMVIDVINQFGYWGVGFLIAIENIFPPIPSEVILTFGGFATTISDLTVVGVIVSATLGAVVGALILYYLGRLLSKERLEMLFSSRLGRILHLKVSDVAKAEIWFTNRGSATVFFCRFVPLIRSLISIPAGMSKMSMGKFLLLTTIGTAIWNTVLVILGVWAGAAWSTVVTYFDTYSLVAVCVLGVVGLVAVLMFWKRRFGLKTTGNKNPYQTLTANTLVFAIGTFSSKCLVFLMLPFYTRMLTSGEYGQVDLIVQACNLIMPMASAGILNAVIRFGLDHQRDKNSVFTTGLVVCCGGLTVLAVAMPLLGMLSFMNGFLWVAYFYIFTAIIRSLCSNFVRSQEMVGLYSLDGLLTTVLTVVFNILFLAVWQIGITGYLLSSVLANVFSIVFLVLRGALYSAISLSSFNKVMAKSMLLYALPLIPNAISIWIVNLSDRYILSALIGVAATGLYAVSYKIPTAITIIASVFMNAWQISTVSLQSQGDSSRFYSNVFRVYGALVCGMASVLIALSQPITTILAAPEYYESWLYMPILILATVFSCYASFFGTLYTSAMKSGHVFITTAVSAALNIGLNFLLIPIVGVQGAGVATLVSYLVMFLIRAIHCRSFVCLDMEWQKITGNCLLLTVQICILLLSIPHGMIFEMLLSLAVLLLNAKPLWAGMKKLLPQSSYPKSSQENSAYGSL